MTHLVVMNGPAGVGKTTLCKHLACLVPGTVCISGDALRSFSPADAKDWLGTRSTYRASAALVSSYLEMGARRVLLDYIFETREAFDWFCGHLSISIPIQLFTIWAPLDTVVIREASRLGRERLADRVLQTYQAMQRDLPSLGEVVHNIDAADVVASRVDALVRKSAGLLNPR
ncbi:AAA family ATPase [Rhizobium sp. NFR03]|uniref:AAA family ATPase n=1 Tax=Rhizobium sp. NFR03 TaxID=1566263 RepID=UPI0008C70995|nr:AAA family ATPase [Rhizobium sp. NFR03]SES20529.1 AAA domain-containing protein [Rhizobium sp. NFR03]